MKNKISAIEKDIRDYRQEILDVLCGLIALPTENPPGRSYRQCADFLSDQLKQWKIDHHLVEVPNGDYPRFSILGTYGTGQDCLHFHGHYDVVPANSKEQFEPVHEGERIYGRGSSDMKGGLVAMLFALRALKEEDVKLKGRVTFSLAPDEETGGLKGTQYLMKSGLLPRPSLGMLMPEPTSGVIWNANKGALTYRVEVKGKTVHVGLEQQGVNAFEQMAEVVHSLLELKKVIQRRETPMKVNPPQAKRSAMLIGGESGSGINFNIVPERAFFTIDRRLNPEEKVEEAKEELIKVFNEYKKRGVRMNVELLQEGESSQADLDSRLALALKQSILDIKGRGPSCELCPGLVEIRFFNNRRIPAYAYGPGLLEVSHGPEEFVRVTDILNCAVIYALTTIRLLG